MGVFNEGFAASSPLGLGRTIGDEEAASRTTDFQGSGIALQAAQDGKGSRERDRDDIEEGLQEDPAGRYCVLAITTVAVVFGLATWFSATAVRCVYTPAHAKKNCCFGLLPL